MLLHYATAHLHRRSHFAVVLRERLRDERESGDCFDIGEGLVKFAQPRLEEGSQLIIPAKLTKAQIKQAQEMAVRAFRAVDCAGLARVDFLMDPQSKKIYVNEINTMPGFTAISMYPKLWAASGVSYPELIHRLIQLALERHEDKKRNKYSR